jgi:ubiquinone/menaquinone biosynthesis C-methylase UbiE
MNLRQLLPKNKKAKILDAGGGTGYCTVPLAEIGYHVALVDVSRQMMEIAKKKLVSMRLIENVDFYRRDLRDLSIFENNTFDMVICQGSVLPCIQHFQRALGEMVRVLKRDCLLNVSVHNRLFAFMNASADEDLKHALKLYNSGRSYWFDFGAKIHALHLFTPSEIENVMMSFRIKPKKIIGKIIAPQPLIEKADLHEISRVAYNMSSVQELLGYAKYLDFTGVKM